MLLDIDYVPLNNYWYIWKVTRFVGGLNKIFKNIYVELLGLIQLMLYEDL